MGMKGKLGIPKSGQKGPRCPGAQVARPEAASQAGTALPEKNQHGKIGLPRRDSSGKLGSHPFLRSFLGLKGLPVILLGLRFKGFMSFL